MIVRSSSVEALREIPQARPDCVITDIMMPGMDGFELTRELRRRDELRAMRIVVLGRNLRVRPAPRAGICADGDLDELVDAATFDARSWRSNSA
ncbi:MAG: response regulator [Burkholderiales bacterium]|nr:response regulator [Burkholderiales bacterium]